MTAPGFALGVLLIFLGGSGEMLPAHEFSSKMNNHHVGWLLIGLGILCILFAAWTVYQRSHISHTERINNNSQPGANVFDNSGRY